MEFEVFIENTSDTKQDIELFSDGKILVVGSFTFYNSNTRNRIILLDTDGTDLTTT
jgi:hypothetical protein